MSGAYVAKPDAVIVPDVPPGWNIDWPFPGPSPPGYTPVYSFPLDAQAAVVPGVSVVDVTLRALDQGEYGTVEPSGDITWSAEWQDTGAVVPIRFAGIGDFASEVTQSWGGLA